MVASKRLAVPRTLAGATASAPPKTLGNKDCMVSAQKEREIILECRFPDTRSGKLDCVGLSAAELVEGATIFEIATSAAMLGLRLARGRWCSVQRSVAP
jgi:hypothetical protein